MLSRVLIVAGSDSGGGAGIQADLKTVTALGAFGATAITALTAQNTLGVFGVYPVPPAFLEQQMVVVLEDIGADIIKTGMLHSAEVIEVVVRVHKRLAKDVPLVVDPVMVAKGGAPLLLEEAQNALKTLLLPRAALITPNLPEAEVLLGETIADVETMRRAARRLLTMGPKAVLLKGGHLEGSLLVDVLATAEGEVLFEDTRIETTSTHGTGCTLASAIATGMAQGLALMPAIQRARKYLRQAIEMAPGLGSGHGPLHHGFGFREP